MNLSRNIIQGIAGGILGGAMLGLLESVYHLATAGAPDLLAPFYGVVLYALIGLPIGLGGALVLSTLERSKRFGEKDEAFALCWGAASAISPMLLFTLYYIGKKVVYLEQGVPATGLLAILGIVGVYFFLQLSLGVGLVRGAFPWLTRGPGMLGGFGALAITTGVVAMLPLGDDPRDSWDHHKPVPGAMADKPNVLIIAVDTLRADHLGTYGRQGNPTPVLDAFAGDAVVFEQGFAAASWTRSSFASLWSSRIPSGHATDKKASRMPDDLVLLSEVLHDNGVVTANLANNINVTSTFNFDQGYDTFIYEAPAYAFGATESVFSLTFYKVVHKLNERLFSGHSRVEDFYQPAEVVLADAEGFMEANKDSRWMLGVHLMEPHDPYFEHPYIDGSGTAEFNGKGYARAKVERPPMSDAEYLKGVYEDEIIHMDKKLAAFFDYLKSSGQYDDLMIVLTADHGEEFGEHGGFWHGTTLYDEQIHVPLIIKLPGNELAGTRVSWQARTLDVAPTITAALGLSADEAWQGEDLLPAVRDQLAEAKAEAEAVVAAEAAVGVARLALTATPDSDAAVAALAEAETKLAELGAEADPCAVYSHSRERTVLAEQDFEGNVLSALRSKGFKYIAANDGNPRGLPSEALYDIVVDPAEDKNLAGSDGDVCGQYISDLPKSLSTELQDQIDRAKATAISGGEVEMSPAEIQRLCALGYLTGAACGD